MKLILTLALALGVNSNALQNLPQRNQPVANGAIDNRRMDLVPIVAQVPDAPTIQAGIAVAKSLNPEDLIVATELRGFDEQAVPAFRKQKEFIALEAQYPGIVNAVANALRPVMELGVRANLPKSYGRMGLFFAQRFSRAELIELDAFYRSLTGQKLIRGMFANASMGQIVSEAVADPEGQTSLNAVKEIFRSSLNAIPGALDKSDQEKLSAFARKPFFARLTNVGSEMRILQQQMINEADPKFEAEMEKAVTVAVESHIAATTTSPRSR